MKDKRENKFSSVIYTSLFYNYLTILFKEKKLMSIIINLLLRGLFLLLL